MNGAFYIMNNLIYRLFLASILCWANLATHASEVLLIEEGSLFDFIESSEVPEEEINEIIKLNKSGGLGDYFTPPVRSVKINNFRVIFKENEQSLLVLRNDRAVSNITQNSVIVYKQTPQSPSIGTELAEVENNYIKYNGKIFSIEDFQLDGADVIYRTDSPKEAESFIADESCNKIVTITAGVACCKKEDGFTGYRFNKNTGWGKAKIDKLDNICKSLDNLN